KVESLGQAAARLLARLERAAKAKERDRRLDFQCSSFVNGTRCCQPPAVEERIGEDRAETALDGIEIQESASRSARGGEDGSSSGLAATIRPAACNDNRHARASDGEGRPL